MPSNLVLLFATHLNEGYLTLEEVPEPIKKDVKETAEQLQNQEYTKE
ncbi:hypothetical protein [Enterococcus sp.]